MSRTYAHRPYLARFAEPGHIRELHDHRHGPCELAPLAEWLAAHRAHRHGVTDVGGAARCRYELDEFGLSCGCALCTNRDERHQDRRRTRHQGRVLAREALTERARAEPA